MMHCKTDLEQLFAGSSTRERKIETVTFDPGPSAACIARWEDDGGRTLDAFATDAPFARVAATIVETTP